MGRLTTMVLFCIVLVVGVQGKRSEVDAHGSILAQPGEVANAARGKNDTGLIYRHLPAEAREPPDEFTRPEVSHDNLALKYGKCCKRKDRRAEEDFRWFYWMEEKPGGEIKFSSVYKCPGKWEGTEKADCNGMTMHNKNGYVEDTDWVLCCRKGEKTKYKYYTGSDCNDHNTTFSTCTSYQCEEYNDVDSAAIECAAGEKKYLNQDITKYCSASERKRIPGFSDMECAGFTSNCQEKYCIIHSRAKRESETDCAGYCSGKGGYVVEEEKKKWFKGLTLKPKGKKSGSTATSKIHASAFLSAAMLAFSVSS